MPVTRERLLYLALAMFLVAMVVFLIVTVAWTKFAVGVETRKAEEELMLRLSLRKNAAEHFFDDLGNDAEFLATSDDIRDAIVSFKGAWTLLDDAARARLRDKFNSRVPNDGSASSVGGEWETGDASLYEAIHDEFHNNIRLFVERGNYHDLLLLDLNGDFIYSVFKGSAFATNISEGEYWETALHGAFQRLRQKKPGSMAELVDFALLDGDTTVPFVFAVVPVFDAGNKVLGMLALQVDGETIDAIDRFDSDFGKEATTYLFGSDYQLRSRTAQQGSVSGSTTIRLAPLVEATMEGQSGVRPSTNSLGRPVLTAYLPVNVKGTTWALIAELPTSIVASRINRSKLISFSALITLFVTVAFGAWVANIALFANRAMSFGDIDRVRQSWARIENPEKFGRLFFEQLFERDAVLRAMFHSDMEKQAARFVQMLGHLIKNLDTLDKQAMTLVRLGRDHAEYGVRISNFETFGVCLMGTMSTYPGLNLTSDERDSWADFYYVVCSGMAKGMAR